MFKLIAGRQKIFFWYWLPLFVYAGFIFFLSSLSVRADLAVPGLDKVMHLGEYLVFGVLLWRAIEKSFPQDTLIKYYLWIILFSFLYGISDEVHQLFVKSREFSFLDVFADVVGATFGGLLYRFRTTKVNEYARD